MSGTRGGDAGAMDGGQRLMLLRHAKSDWPQGVPDERRPLAARGRRDAPAAGRWLAEHAGALDLVLCSTAVRARQTWELAVAELTEPPAVRYEPRVYAASAAGLLALVRELPQDVRAVALVGHNPGVEDLASQLSGTDLAFRTSSIALLSVPGAWAAAGRDTAHLEAFATPRG